MSGSVNKVILIGRLGKDPTVRATAAGGKIVSFSLATSESWRDKASGERKERTEWHQVVIFNEGLAKIAEAYLKKGSAVFVEGQLASRKYTGQDGVERFITEVVLSKFRGELSLLDRSERPAPTEDAYGKTTTRDPAPQSGGSSYAGPMDMNDEIPF